ncbi:MAG: zinc-ribbon domain-containing protein, partial [bacterium]|nr:zinc-ribbon domain-containing protein [bacterium]
MIITCPSCETRFSVSDSALADHDTVSFQCSRCRNTFEVIVREPDFSADRATAEASNASSAVAPATSSTKSLREQIEIEEYPIFHSGSDADRATAYESDFDFPISHSFYSREDAHEMFEIYRNAGQSQSSLNQSSLNQSSLNQSSLARPIAEEPAGLLSSEHSVTDKTHAALQAKLPFMSFAEENSLRGNSYDTSTVIDGREFDRELHDESQGRFNDKAGRPTSAANSSVANSSAVNPSANFFNFASDDAAGDFFIPSRSTNIASSAVNYAADLPTEQPLLQPPRSSASFLLEKDREHRTIKAAWPKVNSDTATYEVDLTSTMDELDPVSSEGEFDLGGSFAMLRSGLYGRSRKVRRENNSRENNSLENPKPRLPQFARAAASSVRALSPADDLQNIPKLEKPDSTRTLDSKMPDGNSTGLLQNQSDENQMIEDDDFSTTDFSDYSETIRKSLSPTNQENTDAIDDDDLFEDSFNFESSHSEHYSGISENSEVEDPDNLSADELAAFTISHRDHSL